MREKVLSVVYQQSIGTAIFITQQRAICWEWNAPLGQTLFPNFDLEWILTTQRSPIVQDVGALWQFGMSAPYLLAVSNPSAYLRN